MKTQNTVMEEVQEIHKELSGNKNMGKFISWCAGIIAACSIGMLGFIWQLKEDVPLLKQGYINTNNSLNTLQNSVNQIQVKQQASAENQARVEERLKNIETKIDKQ